MENRTICWQPLQLKSQSFSTVGSTGGTALAQATTGDASTTFGISASVGTQSSKSESHSGQNTATGSTLTAGDNLSITATGGDITTIGSQIKAGLDVALNAADDINLISSQNT
ncbi:hemagglutinin repeat-containing protein, partial [Rahnella sp. WP5]|uniref:hemagglutinin repeat-containing protein n=1 Tax=Rahnella sp. WP5 TaxID=1500266 RepID=UPI0005655512